MKWAIFNATSPAVREEVELTPAKDSQHLFGLDLSSETVERYFYAKSAWEEINVHLRGLWEEAENSAEKALPKKKK